MLGTKSINARCGSLSASRKADGMRMSSPSRPYCAKHDTSCVRTKGYIIIAVAKALSPTPSVTRASMTFSRPTSRYRTLSDNTNLNDKDLDDAYLHLCDHQIIRIQFGGSLCIPERKIPLRRALFARRPLNYRIKAILKALSGNRYCGIVARTRKVLKR